MRERRSSAISSTSLNGKGKGLERTNTSASTRSRMSIGGDRKSSELPGARLSMSSMREEEERKEQQDRRPPPLPLLSSTPTSPAPWLNVPATPPHNSPAHSSSSSSARTATSTSPTGSSRSSPASSVASLHMDGNSADRAIIICSAAAEVGSVGNEGSRDRTDDGDKPEGIKIEDEATGRCPSTTATPTRKHKEKRKSLSISGSLKSWKSLRSTHKSTLGLDVPDMPALPRDNSSQEKGPVEEDSKDKQNVAHPASDSDVLERGLVLAQHEPVVPTVVDQLSPPSSIEPATLSVTFPKLKKRKSASALLARVKSWRWKKEGPVGEGVKQASEGKEGDVVNMEGGEEMSTVDGKRHDEVPVEKDSPKLPSGDISAVEAAPNVQMAVDIDNNEATEDVAEEVDVGVEGLKEVLNDEDDEGSADSPYPGSTPSTTHSIPSFVPMSLMIPSPNLHVEDRQMPAFIEGKRTVEAEADDLDKRILIEIVPCTPIDNAADEEEEERELKEEPRGPKTDDEVMTVTVTSTLSSNIDKFSSQIEQAPIDLVTDVPAAVDENNTIKYRIEDNCPRDPRPSTPESHPPSPSPSTPVQTLDGPSAPIHLSSTPSSHIPSRPSTPTSSIRLGRSSTRSKVKSRGRSSSVRRMWNAFICGAADAEQMAFAEAWAEIQAERGLSTNQNKQGKGEDEEKAETVEIVIVGVDLDVDSKPALNRPSFSEIGKAL